MAIISIQDLELYLQKDILSTSNEDKYEFLIGSVQDLADSITYRTLEETSHISELHDGDGNDELYLNNYPIISIEEVKYGSAFGVSERSEILSDDYLVDNDIGRLSFGFNSMEGINQVFSVTYVAGYTLSNPSAVSNAPEDLKMILMDQIENTFVKRFIDPMTKSEKIGDYKIERFGAADIAENSIFAEKLSKYIKLDL